MKSFSTFLACVGLICAAPPALTQVQPQPAGTMKVNVAAGDLADAVDSLGKQTGVNVLYPGDLLNGRTTAGVAGTMSSLEAFAKLVEGNSLTATQEYGGMRIAQAPPRPAAAPMSVVAQGDASVAATWERRELHYSRNYGQPRNDVERALKRLGAREVAGSNSQATCLVLVLAPLGGNRTPDSLHVAARWEKVTFRADNGIKRGGPDAVSPILFDELKKDILRLFVTRNLEVQNDDTLSVEVLYPASASAESHATAQKPARVVTDASCRNVSDLEGKVHSYCGSTAQWAEFESRMEKLDGGFSCKPVPGSRPLCLFARQWQYVERNNLLRANTLQNGFGIVDGARESAMAIEHNEYNAVRQDLLDSANGRPLPIP